MDDLTILLNRLPPPQLPDSVSESDQQLISLLLESGKQQMRPYDGTFEASWLLTSFDADVWETTNRGREELVDGQWKNNIRMDWRVILPRAELLTDAPYERLLTCVKKIAFFMRSGLITGTSAPTAWSTEIYKLIGIARWTVLHEERFQPKQHCFRLIDQAALEWLFSQCAEGGWIQAMQIPQRLLTVIYRGAHGAQCPQSLLDNPFELPTCEIGPLVNWLEHQGSYKSGIQGTHLGKRFLRRERLARLINESAGNLSDSRITRFCRQFEPDFSGDQLLVGLHQETELPPHWIGSVKDVEGGTSQGSIRALSTLFATILDAHHHLPDLLPEPADLSIARASRLANRDTKPSGHTPFMPVNTGLTYLNTAMRFVNLYGQAIIGLYLNVIQSRKKKNKELDGALKRCEADWRITTGEPITTVLNITKFRMQEGSRDFERFRFNPTLDDALRMLIGSCIVCIAQLKPSREEELTHLKRNCIRQDAHGYWLNFILGKSNVKGVEVWQELDRPIPVISAKAIQLLQSLGEGLAEKYAEDRKFADNLFYLPKFRGLGTIAPNKSLLTDHLDLFCDFVNLPPDSEGRRWYVRIHEMRKWFLLLLFWSGRFDALDAGRWIAGHTDAEHMYAYIEKEFPGEELPQIEAEYAIDRLYRQDKARKRGDGAKREQDGADALYEAVLLHFNVESLVMVPESEWAAYVHSLRKEEKFQLEPHSIFGDDGREVVGINVSFVMRETT
jgi:hypothetical protein